ncbi:MAG: DeoR/GlpR transcriptional regulator [Spirochaetales bacterium]|nr:DeoR/GlpR transcriptional regulator [Spirochaetales bacterium]
MLERERQALILRVLRQGRFAAVADLVPLVRASEATVRRDLARLEDKGLLRRVRGGAELAEPPPGAEPQGIQLPFEYRKGVQLEKKRAIARRAASLCGEGDTVFIDGGSTTYQMTEFLRSARLQIITNSFAIAQALVGVSDNTVVLNGGVIYPDSQLILDPFQEGSFGRYYASRAFMGVYGLDELGATNTELLLIRTERAMIEHSRDLVVLADSSKFSRRGSLMLCGLERIRTLITDSGISREQADMVRSRGVELIVV